MNKFAALPTTNEFINSSKIRVASIMKQLVSVIDEQEKNLSTFILDPKTNKPIHDQFFIVTTLVNLLNAELKLYSLSVNNHDEFMEFKKYLEFIYIRYNLKYFKIYTFSIINSTYFQIDLYEDYWRKKFNL